MSDERPKVSSYLASLPALFQEVGPDGTSVLGRFLLAFEEMLTGLGGSDIPGLEEILDGRLVQTDQGWTPNAATGVQCYFTPSPNSPAADTRAPDEFLELAAGWVALTFQPAFQAEEKRRLLARIVSLYAKRGTLAGLSDLLYTYTGMGVKVTEYLQPFQLGEAGKPASQQTAQVGGPFPVGDAPHYFSVQIVLKGVSPEDLAVKERVARLIIEQEKPAHTYYRLDPIIPQTIQIGVYSHVGKDTLLGTPGHSEESSMAEYKFDPQKRLSYYTGQFLQEADFRQQQDYHVDRQRKHNAQLHTPGVADGLVVTAVVGDSKLTVSAGTAVNRDGVQIVVAGTQPVSWNPATTQSQTLLVVLGVTDVPSDLATVGDAKETRMTETPSIQLVPESPAPSDLLVRLARITTDASGVVKGSVDGTVTQRAGAVLGDTVTAKRLKLRQGDEDTGPELSWTSSTQASLTTGLSVGGQLSAAGFTGNLLSNFRLVKTDTVDVPGGDVPNIVISDNLTADKVTPHFALITAIVPAPGATQNPNIDPRIRYVIGTSAGTVAVVLQLHNDGGKGKVTYKVIALNG